MTNQDQAGCQVVYTFCQQGQISQACGVFWVKGAIVQGYYDQLLFKHMESQAEELLEKSQRLFPFTPFWFPAGSHSAAEGFRTSELRGMWWIFALVWFRSSSTPAGGQCPTKTVGIMLLYLILHSFVLLTPSTMNSWALNIFLLFLPAQKFPLAWINF